LPGIKDAEGSFLVDAVPGLGPDVAGLQELSQVRPIEGQLSLDKS
jgi:hypothetical protein